LPSGFLPRRAKTFVGLDIGTSRIKMVELAVHPESVELVRAAVEPTPPESLVEGRIVNPAAVAGAIKRAIAAGKFRAGDVFAAVAGQGVVVRHAKFPNMPAEELRQAMQWEAQKYIPFPVEQATLDFTVLPTEGDQQTTEVMLVAAKSELIESHLQTMELAGLTPVAIDVQPFTMLRALRHKRPGVPESELRDDDAVTAYLDVGAGTTDIVIAKGELVKFTRIVPIGGAMFTKAIAERLGVGFDEAERIKIERSRLYRRGEEMDADDVPVSEAMSEVAASLALEIRRSIDYHDMQPVSASGGDVKSVILAGGGAALRGLDAYIGDEVGLPTEMSDPLKGIIVNPRIASKWDVQASSPMLAVGIGLALREVVD
jgi:type IV pilus assembly protein PilM